MMKDKKRQYWFKRRMYGYGWIPVTWQGWASIAVFSIVLIGVGLIFPPDEGADALSYESVRFIAIVAVLIVGLLLVSYKKGPKPKWRWGAKPTDNKDEDFTF
jgi:hypothetical protein